MTVVERRNDPGAVERVLRSLPTWFGIEEAVLTYVDRAATQDSYLAVRDGEVVGAALVERHFDQSAELTLIAVHAGARHQGVGTALLERVAGNLVLDGVRLLGVHTVGPSFADEGYAETRAFYLSRGFVPLQEVHGVDWDGPTLILVRPLATG